MLIVRRARVRLKDQPGDLVPGSVRFVRHAVRHLSRRAANRAALSSPGFVTHLGVHDPANNAGDTVLFVALRALFDRSFGQQTWLREAVRKEHDNSFYDRINEAGKAIVVGGGGLISIDSRPGSPSGWQWALRREQIDRINVPIVLFAIGYNLFRGQPGLTSEVVDHLAATVERSSFVGLRNTGSIEKMKDFLPESAWDKLAFQPCMTTILRHYFPGLTPDHVAPDRKELALNLAFDRRELRYGKDEAAIMERVVSAMRQAVAKGWKVHIAHHAWDDDPAISVFRNSGVPVEIHRLNRSSAQEVVQFYARMPLTIGVRGHAQMIPFGCGNGIISLVSHEKLGYFLKDIGQPGWGVDIHDPELTDRLVHLIDDFDLNRDSQRQAIAEQQLRLLDITRQNLERLRPIFVKG